MSSSARAIDARFAATDSGEMVASASGSSLQRSGEAERLVRNPVTQFVTVGPKRKSLAPMETATSRTGSDRAMSASRVSWPSASSPGLNFPSSSTLVVVRALEQATFTLRQAPPRWIAADRDRKHSSPGNGRPKLS